MALLEVRGLTKRFDGLVANSDIDLDVPEGSLFAVIASLLPEVVRSTGRFQDIAYAAVLILMLIFVPKGLSALGGIGRRRAVVKAGAEG